MDELKVIKDYFPKSYNKFTKIYGLVSSNSNSKKSIDVIDTELIEYIKTYTKGLNIKVNYVKDTNINAFTIPTYIDSDLDSRSPLIFYPFFSDLYQINVIYYKLLKANVDGFTSNGITTFTHNLPEKFVLETYQTSRFFSLLSQDVRARFAVTLHEIGHWHSYNPYLITSLFTLMKWILNTLGVIGGIEALIQKDKEAISYIIIIIALLNVIIFFSIHYVRSINEENCDKFAKKLGYGEDLSRAMFSFNYGSNDFNSLNKEKFLKYTSQFSFKVKDFIHRILRGYPSDQKRIEIGITENILNLSLEIELKNLTSSLDQLFSS